MSVRMGLGRVPAAAVALAFAVAAGCAGSETTDDGTTSSGGPVITGVGGGPTSTSTSSTGTTSVVVSSSSVGGAGGATTATTTTTGTGGMGASPPVCNDPYAHEPNESELVAHQLENAAINECDNNGGSVQGVIAGPDDVDWFTYDGDDTVSLCMVDPGRALTQSESGIRLCKYIYCQTGAPSLDCPGGTSADTSPEGVPGCCGTQAFSLSLDCPGGTSDDATVWIRLDMPTATAATCNEYTLSYHF